MSLVLEQDHVIMHGVSWQTFHQLLADRGERCGVLLAYDRGTVELRMPSQEHEWVKTTLTQIVDAIAFARDLHYRSLGSTTFGREDRERGFEPDACFYLAHADAVTLRRPLDLTIDPAPDIVIEVDISRSSLDKLPIYAALEVPEVWRYANGIVEIHCCTVGGYDRADTSRALPGITAAMVQQFLDTARTATNQTAWFKGVVATVTGQSTTESG
jgi:Uma2 family endonuclease